ncbi:uncharacterized protein M6B38_171245 [Iris pallida]|uniref:Uncharacterized protein n=1 Tax=Iris pallida TaxID=29817 RepID=A0AAX6EUJ6_IRIPA|nr:uncharacterized protein M6B38_171245 [Iris pallida]
MASPSGKRGRDPQEEEMCLDNFHSHKRYLSEIIASSLNGLTVGESLRESLLESPPSREEVTAPYSPMSEDSDDSRFIGDPTLSNLVVPSESISRPTSPVSPHGHQRPLSGLFSSVNPNPVSGCTLPAVICSHPRGRRTDSEGRFPSSPSDMCHTADLRKTALLRSVQMRTQPSCQVTDGVLHGSMQGVEEGEDPGSCSCPRAPDEEVGYQSLDRVTDFGDGFRDDSLGQEHKCYNARFSGERDGS